jgi:serine/threonine-protein kinase
VVTVRVEAVHSRVVARSKGDTVRIATLSDVEIARTLAVAPEALADLAATIVRDPNSTIEPAQVRSDAPGRGALADLGGQHGEGIVSGLTIGATLGQGGMGVVRAATQRSLGRKVAVKTLRADTRSEQATLRLLREGWVTGSLEHPNIVPVYDLGLATDGSPIIVLKHIEGSPWSALLRDGAAVPSDGGTADVLEQNLRILLQLCNAVSLAHARGVIHRDLKPENVMVGRFGEVYLVDWGIAVSLRPDPTGRMPLASDAKEMAGTPSYMAPEMLGAIGKLDERTDVYLLGAVLHEILTGHPPHRGETFQQIVGSILLSQFTFPPEVPVELAAIAARAMSRSADDRFATADELRLAVERYLRHRGSLALSAAASRRVEEMRSVLAQLADPDEVRDRVHHLFAEARFGFRQAILACADNGAAENGLREATEMVVVYELDEGTPEAAAAALAELDTPPPELAQRVGEAMRARDRERQRVLELERVNAELDPLTGRRTRMAAAVIMGAAWSILPQITRRLYARNLDVPAPAMYAMTAGLALFVALVALWGRDSLSKTIVNRRTIATVFVMLAAQLTLEVGGHVLGVPVLTLFVLHVFGWFVMLAAYAVLVERRFWPSVAAFFAAFLYSAAQPASCFHAMSLANLVLIANFFIAWIRPAEDTGFVAERLRFHRDEAWRKRDRRRLRLGLSGLSGLSEGDSRRGR